jgi:hypothetical protein
VDAALAARDERPTLVLYQVFDANAQYASPLYSELTSAAIKQLTGLDAGNNGLCGYHLFNGADAEFVATVTGFIDQYNGALVAPPPPPPPAGTTLAVEYYYADWGFYFETAFPDEIAALDAGAFGGVWKRTGQTFSVWPQPTGSASPTCRFFSTTFAPRSSHFYTPFSAECEGVKNNPNWEFESIAFYIQLADANGVCPAGTVPLYRAYNNGMGGAPNHRYTTSLAILNQMIAAGYVFEGNQVTQVFACVPE